MSATADPGEWDLSGLEALFPAVNQQFADGDSMLHHGNTRQYFEVGASALSAILASLRAARIREADVHGILDYASGYGRVLRWLQARFPAAKILAADTVLRAVTSARDVLGADIQHVGLEFQIPLERTFDLIWSGSLITHLAEEKSRRAIGFLARNVNPGGILVFTTHGPYVEKRIRTGEILYGLLPDQVEALLATYAATGYGFGLYPGQVGYGISISRASRIAAMIEDVGLTPVFYGERAWAHHQDVFAAVRPA